jgi:hypothetical protein
MRRSLTMCRNGVAVAASLVLLTACSGSDDGGDSTSADSTSSSSESSAGGDVDADTARFCAEAASIQDSVGDTLSDPTQQGSLAEAMQQAADAIRGIDPPEEIAADWATLADGADQIAAVFADLDPNDPAALEELQTQLGGLTAELEGASANIEAYLADECGITPEPDPAAPTS